MKDITEQDIAVIIDLWYLNWKDSLVNYENKTHCLGIAKEELKMLFESFLKNKEN